MKIRIVYISAFVFSRECEEKCGYFYRGKVQFRVLSSPRVSVSLFRSGKRRRDSKGGGDDDGMAVMVAVAAVVAVVVMVIKRYREGRVGKDRDEKNAERNVGRRSAVDAANTIRQKH